MFVLHSTLNYSLGNINETDPDSSEDTPNTSTVSVDNNTSVTSEPEREPYFEPVVHLPEVKVKTNEEEEAELLKLRCKLFRYHNQESPAEWKERGTGDIKILHHRERNTVRVLMRQDKTLKIRANHYITPFMELKPNCNSDRAFVWSSRADFADEEVKQETFAIRFANVDHAKIFKDKFNEAKGIVTVALVKGEEETSANQNKKDLVELVSVSTKESDDTATKVTKELESLSVTDKDPSEDAPKVTTA